jgi:hypothetical protein
VRRSLLMCCVAATRGDLAPAGRVHCGESPSGAGLAGLIAVRVHVHLLLERALPRHPASPFVWNM